MKYLEKTVNFIIKNYLLAIPLWAMQVIPAVLGSRTVSLLSDAGRWMSLLSDPSAMRDPVEILGIISSIMPLFVGAGIISFVLAFVVLPATYGMINKAAATGHADLNDFVPALKENIVKYILYWLGTLVVFFIIGIAMFLVILLLSLLVILLKWFGIIIAVLAFIAILILSFVINALLGLWFPSMVIENLSVFDALKKSISIVSKNLLVVVGITLLISVASAIVGFILSFLDIIPVIGPIITSIIPALSSFALFTFYIMIYREKSSMDSAAV